MKEYFKEQLENSIPITEEKLSKLKGRSIYGSFEVGDHWLVFMSQEIMDSVDENGVQNIEIELKTISDRHLDQLANDYKYIKSHGNIPVFNKLPVFSKK